MEGLGETLRRLRRAAGLSQGRAAEQAEVTKGYLSKVEASKSAPSIAVLQRLADVYGIRLADVFTDLNGGNQFSLVRASERRAINRDGTELGYVFESVAFRKADRRAEAFVLTLPPVESPRILYRHKGEEIFFVLEGRVRFLYGGAEYSLAAGDCVYFDSSVDHRGEAEGRETARAFVVILPSDEPPPGATDHPPDL